MPGPPPPPPAAPPPPVFTAPKGGGPDDRGALLKSIRQGAKLKKTVTVDKSAPMIPGKLLRMSLVYCKHKSICGVTAAVETCNIKDLRSRSINGNGRECFCLKLECVDLRCIVYVKV